jgi:hypothetical protein
MMTRMDVAYSMMLLVVGGDNYDQLLGLGVGGEDPHRKVTMVKRTFTGLVMASKNS